jgi:hypothetical protein
LRSVDRCGADPARRALARQNRPGELPLGVASRIRCCGFRPATIGGCGMPRDGWRSAAAALLDDLDRALGA